MSQHVAGSRLTSNIKITLKIKFTSDIFADITRSLVVVLQHLRFCKKILILIFFSDLFSVECKFFCPNSADNTMENRAISLVESSRDNSLISCPTSSAVDHQILLKKLEIYAVKGDALALLKSYLIDRTQKCQVNGTISSERLIKCGVPQGSILGPLFFLLYINDLPQCLSKTKPRLFADDINP